MYRLFFILITGVLISSHISSDSKQVFDLGEYRIVSKDVQVVSEHDNKFSDDIFWNQHDDTKYLPSLTVKSIDDIYSFHDFSLISSEENRLKISLSSKFDYSFSGKFCFNSSENDINRIHFSLFNDDGHRDHSKRKERDLSVYSAHHFQDSSVAAADAYVYDNDIELPFPVPNEHDHYSIQDSGLQVSLNYSDEQNRSTGLTVLKKDKNINGAIWSDVSTHKIEIDHKKDISVYHRSFLVNAHGVFEKLNADNFSSRASVLSVSAETEQQLDEDTIASAQIECAVSNEYGAHIAPSITVKRTVNDAVITVEAGRSVEYHDYSSVYFGNDYIAPDKADHITSEKQEYIRAGISKKTGENDISLFVGRSCIKDKLYFEEKILGEVALQPSAFHKTYVTQLELSAHHTIDTNWDVSLHVDKNIYSGNIPYVSPLDIHSEIQYSFDEYPALLSLESEYVGNRYIKKDVNIKTAKIITHSLTGTYMFDNNIKTWLKISNLFGKRNYKRYNYSMPLSRVYFGVEWLF